MALVEALRHARRQRSAMVRISLNSHHSHLPRLRAGATLPSGPALEAQLIMLDGPQGRTVIHPFLEVALGIVVAHASIGPAAANPSDRLHNPRVDV